MSKDKQFIDGMFVDEVTTKHGEIIKLTFTDAFIEYYNTNKKANKNGNMQLKVDLKRAKESKKLYAELNTFVANDNAKPVKEVEEDFIDDEICF